MVTFRGFLCTWNFEIVPVAGKLVLIFLFIQHLVEG